MNAKALVHFASVIYYGEIKEDTKGGKSFALWLIVISCLIVYIICILLLVTSKHAKEMASFHE